MLRRLNLLLSLIMVAVIVHAQFTISGLPVIFDPLTGNYLCSIRQENYDHDMNTTLRVDSNVWDAMIVDGLEVTTQADYTFAGVTGGRVYPFKAVIGTDTLSYGITFTYYPILQLNGLDGDFGTEYKPSEVILTMPGEMSSFPMLSRTKWRGNTTVRYTREKRNYHIKFVDDEGNKVNYRFFPEMRQDNSWLLDAGQVDNARIRNRVGMNLWMDLVPPMYYQQEEPKALNGVHSRIVEVFLDGKYHGFYSMSEAVDRKQLKLKKYDEDTKAIHGQLWKASKWNDYTCMTAVAADYHKTLPAWNGYELKYPDISDVKPTDWTPLYRAIDFVVNSTKKDFIANVAQHFDLPVLQRYYILYQLLLAWDNGGKNIYWAIYDKDVQEKLTLVAWDFDATVGQDYINRKTVDEEKLSPERDLTMDNRLFKRLLSYDVDGFKTNMIKDYYKLRKTMLSDDSLIARYVDEINDLQHCGAAQRETVRWSGVVDLYYRNLDFDAQKEKIADWWQRRLAHLDNTLFKVDHLRGDVSRDFIVDVDDVNAAINAVLGLTPYDGDADLNGDGLNDVDDVNEIINIILKMSSIN